MSQEKYKTYKVTEVIVIEQEIPARDIDDALEKYTEMMKDAKTRVFLTTEGCTSTSTTTIEFNVELPD